MKKLKVNPLENAEKEEIKIVEFLKKLDLENISKLTVSPAITSGNNYTMFKFYTKTDEAIHFHYEHNHKIMTIRIWERGFFLGKISPRMNEDHEKKNSG